jgi:hypothetical protein
MKSIRLVAMAAGACLLLSLLSCDKINGAMKNVEGKVAGQVLSSSGHGRGYVSVELVPAGDGGEANSTLAEEAGNFMIEEVTPGTYTLHVKDAGGTELPSDTPTVKVGPGRTMEVNITLTDAPAPAS